MLTIKMQLSFYNVVWKSFDISKTKQYLSLINTSLKSK